MQERSQNFGKDAGKKVGKLVAFMVDQSLQAGKIVYDHGSGLVMTIDGVMKVEELTEEDRQLNPNIPQE